MLVKCVRMCACLCVFKQSCECLMNLLCSDWKLIKTASNRQPPTENHWQHTDRQITALRRERGREGSRREKSLQLSDALPTTLHVMDYSNLSLAFGVIFESVLSVVPVEQQQSQSQTSSLLPGEFVTAGDIQSNIWLLIPLNNAGSRFT